MIERVLGLSPYHGIDEHFRLCYGERFDKRLEPCEPITDWSVLLGIIDNKHINPQRLMLVPKDKEIVRVTIPETGDERTLTFPGKSAIICVAEDDCGPELIRNIVTGQLSGQPDRRDHLHMTTIGEVQGTGWVAYWAPLQLESKVLHARLVAERTIRSGEEPTIEDAKRLANAFRLAS